MQPEPIAKTISAVFKELSASKREALQDVYNALLGLLDEKEKKHIKPHGLRSAVLTLYVDSPAWMYALNLKKAQLIRRLQEKISQDIVKEIRFRIGTIRE